VPYQELTSHSTLQIVLLFTKAVSDFFGGGGMSDQMIKFNGFPFLEKEDKEAGDASYLEPSKCRRLFPPYMTPLKSYFDSCQCDEAGYRRYESRRDEDTGNR
jgi:hypothetical protein